MESDEAVQVNICTVGIPPLRTRRVGEGFMGDYQDYTIGIDENRFSGMRQRAREALARLIGGVDADEIAITKNTTEGVCILASGYPLGPGDNVVTCDMENQSNLFPWFNNSIIRGYEVRVAKTSGGRISARELEALVDGGTKIVSISAVQAGTGYFADLAAISEVCRRHGAILAVDAIQALGRMRIDAPALGIDYLSCGGFKGLLSGFGVGFLWCKSEILGRLAPPYVGFQSAVPYMSPPAVTPGIEGFRLVDGINRIEAGTYNMHGVALMESSVGLILQLGPEAIEEHILGLEGYLRQKLSTCGLEVLTPESEARRSGIVIMYYPKEGREAALEILGKHRIRLTHRPGYMRLAIGIYNTESDMDKVARAMEEIGKAVVRG